MAYDPIAQKKYYEKNKERILKRQSAYNQKKMKDKSYKEYHQAYMKRWRQKNREQHNKQMIEGYHNNKEKWVARKIADKLRGKIIKSKGKKCNNCGKRTQLEIHHKSYSTSRELKEVIKITEVLCKQCHKAVHGSNTSGYDCKTEKIGLLHKTPQIGL